MKNTFPSLGKRGKHDKDRVWDAIDTSDAYNRQNAETPHRVEEFIEKELIRLDAELDEREIKFFNSSALDYKDYKCYKEYLEGLSAVLRQKSFKLAGKVLKGVHGWEKVMKKAEQAFLAQSKDCKDDFVAKSDASVQAEDALEPLNLPNLDITDFVKLKKSINRIHLSKLTEKLQDIYDRLNNAPADIPSVSQIFEIPDFDMIVRTCPSPDLSLNKLIMDKIKDFESKSKVSLKTSKDTQTGPVNNVYDIKIDMNTDTEIALMRKNRELDTVFAEKLALIEEISRLKHKIDIIEAKSLKNLPENENKLKILDTDKKNEDNYKINFDKVNNRYLSLKHKFQEQEKQFYHTKVIWKIAEAQLKEIKDAWKLKIGTDFVFKTINIKKIIEEANKNTENYEKIFENLMLDLKYSNPNTEETEAQETLENITENNNKSINSKFSSPNPWKNKRKSNLNSTEPNNLVSDTIKKTQDNLDLNKTNAIKQVDDINCILETEHEDLLTQGTDFNSSNPKNLNQIGLKNAKAYKSQRNEESPQENTRKKRNIARILNSITPETYYNDKFEDTLVPKTVKEASRSKNSKFPNTLTLENFESFLFDLLPIEQAKTLKQFILSLAKDSKKRLQLTTDSELSTSKDQSALKAKANHLNKPEDSQKINFTKPKSLLNKIFNEEELNNIPALAKLKIQQALMGHNKKCEGLCEHLKRAMAIKYKSVGIRYPIKTPTLILSVDQ